MALVGPCVRRPESWWVRDRYVEYQMWEIYEPGVRHLAAQLANPEGRGRRRKAMELSEFSAVVAAELELDGSRDLLDLDSLGLVELLALISELAGAPSTHETLASAITTLEAAHSVYLSLMSDQEGRPGEP